MVGDYASKMLKLLVFIFDGTLEPVFAVQIQNDTTLIKAMVALREIRLYHKRKKWFIRAHLQQRRVIVAEMVIGSLPEIRMWFGRNLNSLLRDRAGFRLPCPFQVVYIKFHFHSSKSIGLVVFTAPPHAFLRWNHARTHGIDCHGFDMSYRGRLPAQRFVPPEPSVRVHRVHVGCPSSRWLKTESPLQGIFPARSMAEQQQGTRSASPVTMEVPSTPRAPEKGLSAA